MRHLPALALSLAVGCAPAPPATDEEPPVCLLLCETPACGDVTMCSSADGLTSWYESEGGRTWECRGISCEAAGESMDAACGACL